MRTVSTNTLPGIMGCCDRHQWHRAADIGGWLHRTGPQHLVPVRLWAEQGGIWRDRHCEFSREVLTSRIQAAGGITCAYALTGRRLLTESVELVDGLHRWIVATDLGIGLVPVEMSTGEAESPFAW
jgi:hypothetical protein